MLALGVVYCALASTPSTVFPDGGSDTIVTVDGKIYPCQILREDHKEVQFSLFGDPLEKVYVIPRQKIQRLTVGKVEVKPEPIASTPELKALKKSTKPIKSKPAKSKRHKTTENMADNGLMLGILSLVLTISIVFIPVAFFVGAFALHKGNKALTMLTGNGSKNRRLRRRARWAMILGGLSMAISLGFIVWIIRTLNNWDLDIGPFDGIGTGLTFSM